MDADGPCALHARVTVRGWCYGHIKVRIQEGRKVDQEQAEFAGFMTELQVEGSLVTGRPSSNWLQPINPSNIDARLDALAELMDRAPNYLALAREILNEK